MTEIEKIAYAKSFIDKLAAGVDPTSGALIPEGETAVNPRLSKCFLYISEILSKIIDNPSAISEVSKTSEWTVTQEVLDKIECSPLRISVSTFAKRINSALNSSRKFTATEINDWLLREGFLMQVATRNDRFTKHPTQKGIAIGIEIFEYIGENGTPKCRVTYDMNAQIFIRDHLSDIIALSKSRNYTYSADQGNRTAPFTLSREELTKFPFSQTPLMVSQITEYLNNLGSERNTVKLKATDITGWLLKIGMLKTDSSSEKTFKLPTEAGRSIGIGIEHRKANDTSYSVALYNIEAQKFIIDNIHAIIKVV